MEPKQVGDDHGWGAAQPSGAVHIHPACRWHGRRYSVASQEETSGQRSSHALRLKTLKTLKLETLEAPETPRRQAGRGCQRVSLEQWGACLWLLYGRSMAALWLLYGCLTDTLWLPYGYSMAALPPGGWLGGWKGPAAALHLQLSRCKVCLGPRCSKVQGVRGPPHAHAATACMLHPPTCHLAARGGVARCATT